MPNDNRVPEWVQEVVSDVIRTPLLQLTHWCGKLGIKPNMTAVSAYVVANHEVTAYEFGKMDLYQIADLLKWDYERAAAVAQTAEPSNRDWTTVRTLATEWDLPFEATRKALDRWRERNPMEASVGYIQNPDAGAKDPKWLFARTAVEPVLKALRSRGAKRIAKRPGGQKCPAVPSLENLLR